MFGFKKTALVIMIGVSGCGYAGTMGPVCAPGSVSVPCVTNAWSIGAQALYLRSFYSNNNFSAVNTGSSSGTRIFAKTNLDFEWGYKLDASYHFLTGNDLSINWTHWRNKIKSVLAPSLGRIALPDPTILSTTLTSEYFAGADFDAVNAEFAQQVNFGEYKTIRFHAGLQYAGIKSVFHSLNVTAGAPPPFELYNNTTSVTENFKFDGVGPRLGADMSFNIGHGFAVYGSGAVGLLLGSTKYASDEAFVRSETLNTTPVVSSYTGLVPELEAKLGINYSYPINHGNLVLDAGYMITNYFNPLHSSNLDLNTVVEYRSNSDFGLQGPYAGLKWVGSL